MARATVRDMASLGLPPAALRSIPTLQAPISATSPGSGLVRPDGALDLGALLASSLTVRVEIVAGGAPGTATWRWSPDAGTTWSATVATPAAGQTAALVHPALGIDTGLKVGFGGTLSAGARWDWAAVSNVARALDWASGEMDSGLRDRYPNGISSPYPDELIGHEAALAMWRSLVNRGFNPENPTDRSILKAHGDAMAWRQAVAEHRLHPAIVTPTAADPLVALSDPIT